MSEINDGGLAFPGKRCQQVGKVSDWGWCDDDTPTYADVSHPGMTLRDYFAAKALAGLCSTRASEAGEYEAIASDAYAYADAMINAREATDA